MYYDMIIVVKYIIQYMYIFYNILTLKYLNSMMQIK